MPKGYLKVYSKDIFRANLKEMGKISILKNFRGTLWHLILQKILFQHWQFSATSLCVILWWPRPGAPSTSQACWSWSSSASPSSPPLQGSLTEHTLCMPVCKNTDIYLLCIMNHLKAYWLCIIGCLIDCLLLTNSLCKAFFIVMKNVFKTTLRHFIFFFKTTQTTCLHILLGLTVVNWIKCFLAVL